jgi:hypothetical protein
VTARLDNSLRRDELPACLQGLTTPCYLHRASRWKVTALLGLVLAVALAGLAYLAWRWSQGRMPAAEVAFALFLLLFVVVLLRPSTWRAPIVMAADRQGLVVVGSREGVHVPWAAVRGSGVVAVESRPTQATKMPWTVQAGMIRTRRRPPCRARQSRRLLR